jgi:hypothetical protein
VSKTLTAVRFANFEHAVPRRGSEAHLKSFSAWPLICAPRTNANGCFFSRVFSGLGRVHRLWPTAFRMTWKDSANFAVHRKSCGSAQPPPHSRAVKTNKTASSSNPIGYTSSFQNGTLSPAVVLLKRQCSPVYSNAQKVGAPADFDIAGMYQNGYSICWSTLHKLTFASLHALLVLDVVHQV